MTTNNQPSFLCGHRWQHNAPPAPEGMPTYAVGYRTIRGADADDLFTESGKDRRQAYYVNRRTGRIIGEVSGTTTGLTTDDDTSILDSIPDSSDPSAHLATVQPIRGGHMGGLAVYPFDALEADTCIRAFGHNAARTVMVVVRSTLRRSGIMPSAYYDTGYSDCLSFVRSTLSVEFGPFGGSVPIPESHLVVKCRSLVRDWQRREVSARRGGFPYVRYVVGSDGNTRKIRPVSETNILRSEFRGTTTADDQSARIGRINAAGEWKERNIERFYKHVYDRLNDREREMLGLYLRGNKARTIGESLDIPTKTVHQILSRIVLKARTIMPNPA